MALYCPEVQTLYTAFWKGYLLDFPVCPGNCLAINDKWTVYDEAAWQALINEHGSDEAVLEFLGVVHDLRDEM